MSLNKLFDSYIQAGIYLKGWAPTTRTRCANSLDELGQELLCLVNYFMKTSRKLLPFSVVAIDSFF